MHEACLDAGLALDFLCGGKGRCGTYVGRLLEGSISPPGLVEKRLLSEKALQEGYLLLCQRAALGDVALECDPLFFRDPFYEPEKGEVKKGFAEIDPLVSKAFHELSRPTTRDQTADLERILMDLPGCREVDPHILDQIPPTLREADFRVTSVLFQGKLIGLEKRDTTSERYGAAFDIGTTTVAGYLVDLRDGRILSTSSRLNAQASYGVDVLSRIAHALKRKDGFREMQRLILQTIDGVTAELLERVGVQPGRVYAASFVGNTVMEHFFLGGFGGRSRSGPIRSRLHPKRRDPSKGPWTPKDSGPGSMPSPTQHRRLRGCRYSRPHSGHRNRQAPEQQAGHRHGDER